MKKLFFCTLILFVLVSCNAYSPLRQKSSTEDLIEEGMKCLHDGDYACAIEAYNAIPNVEVKNEKLCKVYLTQGGMTLNFLINTVTQNNSKMLGNLAQGLAPWTQAKSDSLDLAKTSCINYAATATTPTSVNQATLLKTISLLIHCATRIAKADVYVANSNSDQICTTPGNNNGTISQSDISEDTTGNISSVGMCSQDVVDCTSDLSSVSPTALTNAGLGTIAGAFNSVPDALKDSNSTVIASRAAIRDVVN